MNRLEKLYKVTKQMEKVVNQEITAENREQVIQTINQLVEQRGMYMKDIIPPYTEAEKAMGEKLIILNKQIQEQLDLLFENLKKEMRQVKKQKKSNQSYINPYQKVQTMDGMFMDQKK
ncbi:MAG TPA: flagellar protein FliT [Candidatus Avamphibacillus sp.]|nr:flagellar protein FliT [Candidatus Avamphibacillus sp.]